MRETWGWRAVQVARWSWDGVLLVVSILVFEISEEEVYKSSVLQTLYYVWR